MKDALAKIIEVASGKMGAEYSEARAQFLSKTMLTVKEGNVEAARQGSEVGVAIRVLINGAWGFATIGSLSTDALNLASVDACKMAKAASPKLKAPIKLAHVEPIEDKVIKYPRKNPSNIGVENKISLTLTMNKSVMESDNRIKSCTVDYLDLNGTDYFMNSDGSFIEQDKLYVWTRIVAIAAETGVLTFSREEIGSTAGYEVFDKQTPEAVGEKVGRRAVQQLAAKSTKAGSFPAILGPDVVGTFVHEAFGHLAEADLTLAGSVLKDKVGSKIGSNQITFYDDGTLEGEFGSYKYDDEGVPSQKTVLVKDGVVVGLMNNRETAYKLNSTPTGNARAEDFRVEPIIRMRNTFIEPRDHSFDELLEDIKFGYFLKSFRGGQANLDGTFQVGVQEAYEIVKGEIGPPVRNASFSGNTLETLHKIDAVGKDFQLSPGRCGKGQTAFVSDGGAHTRVKEVLIGGTA